LRTTCFTFSAVPKVFAFIVVIELLRTTI
jgi:hypothetical protein